MSHFNCLLTPREARSRLIYYKLDPNSPPNTIFNYSFKAHESDQNESDTGVYLLGIMAGEYLLFDKSFKLKVISGSAEIGGHVYRVMDHYRKFIVPPWSPSERLLSLCFDKHKSCYKNFAESQSSCKICSEILAKLYGGTCCEFVTKYKSHRESIMNKFGVSYSEVFPSNDKYLKYIEYYKSQTNQDYDTILMFGEYTSCFGTVSIPECLETINLPRLIPNQVLNTCEILLRLCSSGNPVLMIHGEKNSGKSTLLVYMINYILNFVSNVFLLDVDVGQPIVSPPGLVTLTMLSESITTPCHSLVKDVRPKLSLLMGDIKVSNPFLLLRQVKRCFDLYERSQKSFKAPLIINTFGWVTGIGGHILDAIASITRTEIMVKLVNLPKPQQALEVNGHEDLKYYINTLDLNNTGCNEQVTESHEIDTYPLFSQVVEELGGKVQWNKSNKEYYFSSFQNYVNHFKKFNFNGHCRFEQFNQLVSKKELVAPSDIRWLRFCSYLNNGFSDALHFPQFRHEEFFGSVETYNFVQNVKFPNKFHIPKQVQLDGSKYTFVTQSDILPSSHQELVPMISGCLVGMCKGKVNETFKSKVSDHWNFVSYAYVHYLNPEDLSILVSYPKYKAVEEIRNANIIVLCLGYGFEPCPSKLCGLNSYPGKNTPQLDHMVSQMYPFRRNELLHMVGSFGAGTSAPTQRANLKRSKREN